MQLGGSFLSQGQILWENKTINVSACVSHPANRPRGCRGQLCSETQNKALNLSHYNSERDQRQFDILDKEKNAEILVYLMSQGYAEVKFF